MVTKYGVVIAHREGAAVERAIVSTESDTLDQAQVHADAWTRRHGHRDLDTDRCGFYAYADRITGARAPHPGSVVRIPTTQR